MLILRFKVSQHYSDLERMNTDPAKLRSLSRMMLLETELEFKVNEVDFSYWVPLIWAIRSFRDLLRLLRDSEVSYSFVAPNGTSGIDFDAKGDVVVISGLAREESGRWQIKTVTVDRKELIHEIKSSTRTAFRKICKAYPVFDEPDFRKSILGVERDLPGPGKHCCPSTQSPCPSDTGTGGDS